MTRQHAVRVPCLAAVLTSCIPAAAQTTGSVTWRGKQLDANEWVRANGGR